MVLLGKDKDFFCFFIIFSAFFQIIMGKRLSLQLVIRLMEVVLDDFVM